MLADESLVRKELDDALENATKLSVAPTAILMMAAYCCLSVAHLFILTPPTSFVMAALAGVSIVACALVLRANANLPSRLNSHHLLAILSSIILINVSVHMALTADYLQTTHFALVMVGCGVLMLDSVWFAISLFAYIGTWSILFWNLPNSPTASHFGYLMGFSTCISVAVHIARHRSTVRMETARILGKMQRERMELNMHMQHDQLVHTARLNTMGELVAGISHELNQPLSAISNFATACEIQLSRDETSDQNNNLVYSLKEISAAAVRAGKIIKRIRGFATKSTRVRSDVNLNQVVRDAIELMAPDIRNRNVELKLDLDDNLNTLQADEVQMQQVIVNLLQNGFDALRDVPNGGQLTIKTLTTETATEVSVSDNGPGIQLENPNSVFEAFFTTKEYGLGMGLAICRTIVENHGGRISCTSIGSPKSQGTAFHFALPRSMKKENGQSKT